jgi:ribosome-interacting GTPase 1
MIEGSATRDFTYEFPLDSKTTEEIETILLEVETYTARVLVEKVRLDRIIDTLGGLRSRVDSTLCKRHRSDVYARNGISEEVSMIAMGRTRFEGLSRVDEVG